MKKKKNILGISKLQKLINEGKLKEIPMSKKIEDLGDIKYINISENPKPENLICPVCKSTDIEDISTYQSNGILGPGHSSWKTLDVRCCKDCGVVFKPVNKKDKQG